MEMSDATTIRNNLVGLAQRRETSNYVQTVKRILATHRGDVQLLNELHLLHITVWLTESGDELWKELLRIGCSPFAYDFNGDTTLHYAIRAANLAYLHYLYSQIGERILDVVNHQLCNLMITCCAETPDERSTEVLHCLEWLYLNGMTLEAQDSQGKTALMWAAHRNSLTICHWLLSHGAHLAHRDHMNRTALHVACSSGNYDVVLYLCEQGAINLLGAESHDDRRINTPMKIAWQRGHLWLALNMLIWKINHALTGRCSFLISPYAWGAFLLILWNLSCGQAAFFDLRRKRGLDEGLRTHWLAFTALMSLTLGTWLAAAKSDPGSVRKRADVVENQADKCSDSSERDLRLFERGSPGGIGSEPLKTLRALETQSKRIALQIARLNKDSHGVFRRETRSKVEELIQGLQEVSDKMSSMRAAIARDRQRAVGSSYYVKRVLNPYNTNLPPPRLSSGLSVVGICLTCHHVKSIRQHHCSECGICVHRFDHHCVWIDNCVGVGNQASFILFLGVLAVAQMYYALLAVLYVRESVARGGRFAAASAFRPDHQMSQNLLRLLLTPLFYVTVFNVLVNVLWFCFCVFLLVRTTRSMLTDVTFYESIKRSAYVERRFGRAQGALWDFSRLTIADACLNSLHFLAQDRERDLVNYGSHDPKNALLHADV